MCDIDYLQVDVADRRAAAGAGGGLCAGGSGRLSGSVEHRPGRDADADDGIRATDAGRSGARPRAIGLGTAWSVPRAGVRPAQLHGAATPGHDVLLLLARPDRSDALCTVQWSVPPAGRPA